MDDTIFLKRVIYSFMKLTVAIIRQTLFNKSESIQGKSATHPQAIRPNVFVIPIIDSKKDAWDGSTP